MRYRYKKRYPRRRPNPRNPGFSEREYQSYELRKFQAQNSPYDTKAGFSKDLAQGGRNWIDEQIEWIANGTYGAGPQIALIKTWRWASASRRANKEAAVGQVILKAMHGAPVAWRQLSPAAQKVFGAAVRAWVKRGKKHASLKIVV